MAAGAWAKEAENEQANIDKFLRGMSEYPPPIPDTVITHVLAEAGLSTSDPRVHRTLNVACQKFIADLLDDCAIVAKQRVKKTKSPSSKKNLDLQLSDLKAALEVRGIHCHRPEFIVSLPKTERDE
jgi:transcription initiation factor TFIID subunit 10